MPDRGVRSPTGSSGISSPTSGPQYQAIDLGDRGASSAASNQRRSAGAEAQKNTEEIRAPVLGTIAGLMMAFRAGRLTPEETLGGVALSKTSRYAACEDNAGYP